MLQPRLSDTAMAAAVWTFVKASLVVVVMVEDIRHANDLMWFAALFGTSGQLDSLRRCTA